MILELKTSAAMLTAGTFGVFASRMNPVSLPAKNSGLYIPLNT